MPNLTMPTPDLAAIEFIGCFASEVSVQGKTSLRQLFDTSTSADIRLRQSLEIGLDSSQNQVGIKLFIEVGLLVSPSKEPLDLRGRFEMYFNFEVANLKDLLAGHPAQEITMPTFELAVMLTDISYSTARGILMTRLAGTPLDGFSLPLLNATDLVSQGELISTTKLRG